MTGVQTCALPICSAGDPAADPGRGPALWKPAPPQEGWSFDVRGAFASKYVNRGIDTVDDPVFQPSATVGFNGFRAGVWANERLTDDGGRAGEFDEVDLAASYAWSWKAATFEAGAVYYLYPNSPSRPTTELFASAGLDVPLSPSLTVYQDVEEVGGAYVPLSLSHTFRDVWQPAREVRVSVGLQAAAAYGSSEYNEYYFGVPQSAIDNALFGASLPLAFGDRLKVTPSANYSTLLDRDIRRAARRDDSLWFGLGLTWKF